MFRASFLLLIPVTAAALWFTSKALTGPGPARDTPHVYPPALPGLLLLVTVGFAVLTVLVYASYPAGIPNGSGLVLFIACAVGTVMLPAAGWLQLRSYRVRLQGQGLVLASTFAEKNIALADIRRIVTQAGNGSLSLSLYDRNEKRLARIDGYLRGFTDLLAAIEASTRSPDVTLHRGEQFNRWQEKPNNPEAAWQAGSAPPPAQQAARRRVFILGGIIALVLLGMAGRVLLRGI